MKIAVLDVGSIDGGDDINQVVVRGVVVPTVGYGGMNMHMVDISKVPDAQVRRNQLEALTIEWAAVSTHVCQKKQTGWSSIADINHRLLIERCSRFI